MLPTKKTFSEQLHDGIRHDAELFEHLWRQTGGSQGIFTSIYFILASIFWLFASPWWFFCDWWETSISVLSILLGLSPAGIGMIFGMLGTKLKEILVQPDKMEPSKTPLLGLVGGTLLYIFFTILALLMSLLGRGWSSTFKKLLESDKKWASDEVLFSLKSLGLIYSSISFLVFSIALFSAAHLVLLIYQMAKFSTAFEASMVKKSKTP